VFENGRETEKEWISWLVICLTY